jgi:putative ABC transport system substrate-binding protein
MDMRRREFIAFGGIAVAAGSLGAKAQQADRSRLVGLITGFTDEEMRPLASSFRSRMKELGWVEGRNLDIQIKAAGGDFDKLDADAAGFVAARADTIVAMGSPGFKAVARHSTTVPVVFTQVADPVGQHFIQSLARPGGNATGLTNFEFAIGGKWLELLRQLDAHIVRVTLITNPANPNTAQFVDAIAAASKRLKIDVEPASVRNADDITHAIEGAAAKEGGSLIIFPDSLPVNHRHLIVQLAARYRLPAIYPFRIFSDAGGLISYGIDFKAIYRQAAEYTDQILRGASPGDLPVQAPNKFELIVNLATARALSIPIPQSLQVAADEILGE